MDIYSSFIRNCKTWKQQTKMSTSGTTVVQPDNGISFNTKKEMSYQVTKRHGRNLNAYCMIPTIGHFGKRKTMETIKRSVDARSWGEEG